LRRDQVCSACATTSLPVPVSPRINTSTGESATSITSWRSRSICGERPTSLPARPSRSLSARRSVATSSVKARFSSARFTTSTSTSGENGLGMKSYAPLRMASTARLTSPWPVIMMMGRSASSPCTWRTRLRPSAPGRRMSVTTTPA
jgi:hypothetical protein